MCIRAAASDAWRGSVTLAPCPKRERSTPCHGSQELGGFLSILPRLEIAA